jgi:hypothetical protein
MVYRDRCYQYDAEAGVDNITCRRHISSGIIAISTACFVCKSAGLFYDAVIRREQKGYEQKTFY